VKITQIVSRRESLALTLPYTIATRTIDSVELFFVRLVTDTGFVGLGSASPAESVTGESAAACEAALGAAANDWLIGRDPRELGGLCREAGRRLATTPAARAAVDMALHDLFARRLDLPLVDFLGRCHDRLPTSITIGIKPADETLAEAADYMERGFRCLKVKIGLEMEADVERLALLREAMPAGLPIRVDANQGYSEAEAVRFHDLTRALDLELIEQPLAAAEVEGLRRLPADLRRLVAADESLLSPADALSLVAPPSACGIFNIKLMKCGGITPALAIAATAAASGTELMWGCNDESRISIAAALHAAYACPATRYLDLDGSFDLARDLATGGFTVEEGCLLLPDAPGLGVEAMQRPATCE